jgi:hypothetical protein
MGLLSPLRSHFNLQIGARMQISCVSTESDKIPGPIGVRQLPNPAICRAKPANWPNVVLCLVPHPSDCKQARYFNEVAYCIHPQRDAIMARTKAHEAAHADDAKFGDAD